MHRHKVRLRTCAHMAGTSACAAARLPARLACLPHEALVALAASMYGESLVAADTIRITETCLASHLPMPQWARDNILLSDDILPQIFAHVELEDGAAAAVCTAWRNAWVATEEQRRGLRPAVISSELDRLNVSVRPKFATLPGDRLAVFAHDASSGRQVRILDQNLAIIAGPVPFRCLDYFVAHEGALYGSYEADHVLRRYELTNDERIIEEPTKYEDDREEGEAYAGFSELCLAPNNTLFAVGFIHDDEENDEIVALDATTLSVRFRFGRGLFYFAMAMASVGEELFVCDKNHDTIRVFSLSGEHIRDIKAEHMESPERMVFYRDRLFVVEAGKPIIKVLTLDGQLLQEYEVKPEEDGVLPHTVAIMGIHLLGKKLIVLCFMKSTVDGSSSYKTYKAFALKGI